MISVLSGFLGKDQGKKKQKKKKRYRVKGTVNMMASWNEVML